MAVKEFFTEDELNTISKARDILGASNELSMPGSEVIYYLLDDFLGNLVEVPPVKPKWVVSKNVKPHENEALKRLGYTKE